MILSKNRLSTLACIMFDGIHSDANDIDSIYIKMPDAICLATDVDYMTSLEIYDKISNEVTLDMGMPTISEIIAKHISSL